MHVELVPFETLDDPFVLLPELFSPQPATLQMEFPPVDVLPVEFDTGVDVGCCDMESELGNGWFAVDPAVVGALCDVAPVDMEIEFPGRIPDAEFSVKLEPEQLGS